MDGHKQFPASSSSYWLRFINCGANWRSLVADGLLDLDHASDHIPHREKVIFSPCSSIGQSHLKKLALPSYLQV